jgi:uncharacterized membrane protein
MVEGDIMDSRPNGCFLFVHITNKKRILLSIIFHDYTTKKPRNIYIYIYIYIFFFFQLKTTLSKQVTSFLLNKVNLIVDYASLV